MQKNQASEPSVSAGPCSRDSQPAFTAGQSAWSRRGLLKHAALASAGGLVLPGMVTSGQEPPAAKSAKFKQSVSRWCFAKMPYDEFAAHLARIGYAGIDLIGPKEWPTAQKHGLIATVTHGCGTISDGLNRKENHAKQVAELQENINRAADAGVPNVICFSGNRKGQPDEQGISNCVEAFKQVAAQAEKRGVNVVMEYLNSKVDHQDYQFDHMAYGVAIAKQVGSPRVGILYDIYHAQIMEGDIIRTIQQHHKYILHYHTGGNPGRHEIDDTQELYYPAIMRAIAATGFAGYVGHEFVPRRDPVKSLEQAFAICSI